MVEVIETAAYLASAKKAGMTAADRARTVETLQSNPFAGVAMVGSGGCRKVRIAGRGFGKSGGYRVATYYLAADGEVYLLRVLSKGRAETFSDAEVNAFRAFAKALPRR